MIKIRSTFQLNPHTHVPNASLHEVLLSIQTYLNPGWLKPTYIERMRKLLSTGALVVIRNAFQPPFAERIFQCLDKCTAWKIYEGNEADFHYHHHNLYDARDYPADLALCQHIFDSPFSRDFAALLSGRRCNGPTTFSASWYLPGDHSLPHNDAVSYAGDQNRQVAFVWHLTKEWQPKWGGALFWCPRAAYIHPRFNSLVLFNVGPDTLHFVTSVSPYARGKRLAINGWWTGSDPIGTLGKRTFELIQDNSVSIEVY